jgi:hypothetical protein
MVRAPPTLILALQLPFPFLSVLSFLLNEGLRRIFISSKKEESYPLSHFVLSPPPPNTPIAFPDEYKKTPHPPSEAQRRQYPDLRTRNEMRDIINISMAVLESLGRNEWYELNLALKVFSVTLQNHRIYYTKYSKLRICPTFTLIENK